MILHIEFNNKSLCGENGKSMIMFDIIKKRKQSIVCPECKKISEQEYENWKKYEKPDYIN